MTREQVLAGIAKERLVAILRGGTDEMLEGVVHAMIASGVQYLELTYNQKDPNASETLKRQLRRINNLSQGKLCIGAGTVLSPMQVEQAYEAGANYIVSPDANPVVISRTRALGLVSIPGALSPNEIMQAWNSGADIVKFFPACSMGLDYLKFVRAPLSHIPLLATGGITPMTIPDYLKIGMIGVGVGITVFPPDVLAKEDWKMIERLAVEHLDAIKRYDATRTIG
jgi:2-dehydro-3-deoxyphosphogluconate aldolase/(4S)-4-hydroxy-2-oxoglutarate aldolase